MRCWNCVEVSTRFPRRFEEPVEEPLSFMKEPEDAATKDGKFRFFRGMGWGLAREA